MPVYGTVLQGGVVLIPRVEVIWSPRPWMGTLRYSGKPRLSYDDVCTLKLDEPLEDGTESREIKISHPGMTSVNPTTNVAENSPAFNPA